MFSRCSKVCFAQKTVKVGSLCNSAGSKRVRSRMNGIKWCLPCLGCKASMCFGNIEIVTNFLAQLKMFSRQIIVLNIVFAKQEINTGAIDMSARVLVRAKFFNSINKQCLAIKLIFYRGNFNQCSTIFNFHNWHFFSSLSVCLYFRESSLKVLQLADFEFFSLCMSIAVLMFLLFTDEVFIYNNNRK